MGIAAQPVENSSIPDTSGKEVLDGQFGKINLNVFDFLDDQNMDMVVEGEIESM